MYIYLYIQRLLLEHGNSNLTDGEKCISLKHYKLLWWVKVSAKCNMYIYTLYGRKYFAIFKALNYDA